MRSGSVIALALGMLLFLGLLVMAWAILVWLGFFSIG